SLGRFPRAKPRPATLVLDNSCSKCSLFCEHCQESVPPCASLGATPSPSFFSSLERERVERWRYWTREDAGEDIRNYIDFYNGRRRRSYLDGLCPVDFEIRATLT